MSYFKGKRAKKLLFEPLSLQSLLTEIVGDESLFGLYLFDGQFAHPGWSGMVAMLDENPQMLIHKKPISLEDFILVELLLEIDALDAHFGGNWAPLGIKMSGEDKDSLSFPDEILGELDKVYRLWQEAFEWTYYDQVAAGFSAVSAPQKSEKPRFQAFFCIDDREESIRRYAEKEIPLLDTFGTPGHFNILTHFLPEHAKFHTKICPAPAVAKHIILEKESSKKIAKEKTFSKNNHSLLYGWLNSTTQGFVSAFKLVSNIFHPKHQESAVASFQHMGEDSILTIENTSVEDKYMDLQIGFTPEEMANCVYGVFATTGLLSGYAPLVYFIGHGASSINNTHYAGYDCGACSGRPGSVNARAIAFMANHPRVRELLREKSVDIPKETYFVGGLHDTTKDEIYFYDVQNIPENLQDSHREFSRGMEIALDKNAAERSRRFILQSDKKDIHKKHKQVKERAVSLFEPRPEYNHATNCLTFIGRRNSMHNLFLDRRSFLNSYDYSTDPDGIWLGNILGAAAPVCGGINLEYYFSRVDRERLGAGTKLPHNVMGLIGVANGADGDLRPGLPFQMVEIHDPLRLMMVIEQFPEVILQTLERSAPNNWIFLPQKHMISEEFDIFKNEHNHFFLSFYYDKITAVYWVIGSFLTFLISTYSRVYLHREKGYKRFFNTILFFFFGYHVIIFAGNFETLFVGWEILGLSSFLLIAFYRERYLPVRNALKVFSIYRLGDVGIILAMWASHHLWHENITFMKLNDQTLVHEHLTEHSGVGIFISLMLLLAAAAKSAQLPFSSWLPRAMEGPTPSSAIFYGSLSVHFGAFLLLRTLEFWHEQTSVRIIIGLLGLSSALVATAISRVQSSVKTQIAYSSIAQIGIIFIEIALELEVLALVHFAGNAFLRTYQLLTSPSAVSYLIREQVYNYQEEPKTDIPFSKRMVATLYQLGVMEFRLDEFLHRFVFRPLRNLGHKLDFIAPKNVLYLLLPTFLLGWRLLLCKESIQLGEYEKWLPNLFSFLGLLLVLRAFGEKKSPKLAFLLLMFGHLWMTLAIGFNETFSNQEILIYLSGILLGGFLGVLSLWILRNKEKGNYGLDKYYGHVYEHPRLAFVFLISCLCLMGFPITSTFLGVDIIFSHIRQDQFFLAFFNAMAFVIGGMVCMRIYGRIYLGRHIKTYHEVPYKSN
ncbi:MAG: hypothetical protein C4K58_01355 [Flavobacteriaceae bacterium]|nr:MAG: hypothetical protein C4K58_01355 [Flavobacteriaceae bacterium]